jgi:hypothetical protein
MRRPSLLKALAGVPHENIQDRAAASDTAAPRVGTGEDVVALVTDRLRLGLVVVNHGTGPPGNAIRLAAMCAPPASMPSTPR